MYEISKLWTPPLGKEPVNPSPRITHCVLSSNTWSIIQHHVLLDAIALARDAGVDSAKVQAAEAALVAMTGKCGHSDSLECNRSHGRSKLGDLRRGQ